MGVSDVHAATFADTPCHATQAKMLLAFGLANSPRFPDISVGSYVPQTMFREAERPQAAKQHVKGSNRAHNFTKLILSLDGTICSQLGHNFRQYSNLSAQIRFHFGFAFPLVWFTIC